MEVQFRISAASKGRIRESDNTLALNKILQYYFISNLHTYLQVLFICPRKIVLIKPAFPTVFLIITSLYTVVHQPKLQLMGKLNVNNLQTHLHTDSDHRSTHSLYELYITFDYRFINSGLGTLFWFKLIISGRADGKIVNLEDETSWSENRWSKSRFLLLILKMLDRNREREKKAGKKITKEGAYQEMFPRAH